MRLDAWPHLSGQAPNQLEVVYEDPHLPKTSLGLCRLL